MVATNAADLAEYLHDRLGEDLRSVAAYDEDGREIVYAREDVMETYSDRDVEEIFRDLGIESLEKPFQEDLYPHGELNCTIRCFEDAIEMHFVVDRGTGIAVALEPAAFVAQGTFVGRCMELAGIERP